MFLRICVLSISLIGTALASDLPKSEELTSMPQGSDLTYFPHLSPKSLILLDKFREASPKIAAICSQELGNIYRCNDFLSNFTHEYISSTNLSSAVFDCKRALGSNANNDPFENSDICEKLKPKFFAWNEERINQAWLRVTANDKTQSNS